MDREESDLAYQYQEALQIHRTVQALSHILSKESDELCGSSVGICSQTSLFTAQAFCYSALLNLYDMYSCIDITTPASIGMPGQVELQQTAITGLKELSVVVYNFAKRIKEVVHFEGLLQVSPFVIECLYQAAANHAWYVRETENEDFRRMLMDVKEVLQILGENWGAASKSILYIAIYCQWMWDHILTPMDFRRVRDYSRWQRCLIFRRMSPLTETGNYRGC